MSKTVVFTYNNTLELHRNTASTVFYGLMRLKKAMGEVDDLGIRTGFLPWVFRDTTVECMVCSSTGQFDQICEVVGKLLLDRESSRSWRVFELSCDCGYSHIRCRLSAKLREEIKRGN